MPPSVEDRLQDISIDDQDRNACRRPKFRSIRRGRNAAHGSGALSRNHLRSRATPSRTGQTGRSRNRLARHGRFWQPAKPRLSRHRCHRHLGHHQDSPAAIEGIRRTPDTGSRQMTARFRKCENVRHFPRHQNPRRLPPLRQQCDAGDHVDGEPAGRPPDGTRVRYCLTPPRAFASASPAPPG